LEKHFTLQQKLTVPARGSSVINFYTGLMMHARA
jgi:hypothetical protein